MTDVCVVMRESSGPRVRDPATGESVPPPPIKVYEGKCRLRMANAAAAVMESGQSVVTVQQPILSVPKSVILKKGDRATITRSDDPGNVGVGRTIRGVHSGSQQTAHRYQVEEVH
ncbi:DUF6093 family protein [Brevibacterium casei]|uniref:DUF6093 family protein n=1 Tax=Brevibacterium casei TaxID=33889 RepID=UPI001CBA5FB6